MIDRVRGGGGAAAPSDGGFTPGDRNAALDGLLQRLQRLRDRLETLPLGDDRNDRGRELADLDGQVWGARYPYETEPEADLHELKQAVEGFADRLRSPESANSNFSDVDGPPINITMNQAQGVEHFMAQTGAKIASKVEELVAALPPMPESVRALRDKPFTLAGKPMTIGILGGALMGATLKVGFMLYGGAELKAASTALTLGVDPTPRPLSHGAMGGGA